MILYLLLEAILFIIGLIGKVLGPLVPDFPSIVTNLFEDITTLLTGGLSFISYFFHWQVVVAVIGIIIAWHTFKVIKDTCMKVLGHFIAN